VGERGDPLRAAGVSDDEAAPERVAFVTGGSRGIGRAIVLQLAARGHPVAFCFGSDEAGAKETHAMADAAGARVVAIQASVADGDAVDRAFSQVEDSLGPVTVLVNNAGINADGLLVRMKDDQWRSVIDTDLTGPFLTIRRAAPKMMRARYGRIVNVSSVAAQIGQAGQANYAAAKAGLLGLTRSVARELASRGITANVVAPGPIVTAMTDDMPPEWRAAAEQAVPLGRFGTADEVASVVTFLCSEASAYVTGALVPVDGGLGMGH
jgi:3-oxoacyl-[acyl-carrier protein] reductase